MRQTGKQPWATSPTPIGRTWISSSPGFLLKWNKVREGWKLVGCYRNRREWEEAVFDIRGTGEDVLSPSHHHRHGERDG